MGGIITGLFMSAMASQIAENREKINKIQEANKKTKGSKMKAVLEFDLNEQHEKLAHLRAVKATDAYLVLWDIAQYLRTLDKHGDSDTIEIEKMTDIFYSTLNKYGIDLADLE